MRKYVPATAANGIAMYATVVPALWLLLVKPGIETLVAVIAGVAGCVIVVVVVDEVGVGNITAGVVVVAGVTVAVIDVPGTVVIVVKVAGTVVIVVRVGGIVVVMKVVGAVVVVLTVGQDGDIKPHICANAEVERVPDKNNRKASLGKENWNIASIPFQHILADTENRKWTNG